MTFFSNNFSLRSYNFLEFSYDNFAELILLLALSKACSLGTTLILAIKSPLITISPSSTKILSIIPLTCGFNSISSSGFNLPVATTSFSIEV